ncbi:hypothetical protein HMPREF0321_1071 [Dermacoccus sp. Ellin185]|nr:hypothetical protein HMPREF0321_1071 [Dermacoccus sp. Ellin185]
MSPYARLLGAAGLYPSAIFVHIRDGGRRRERGRRSPM